MNMMSVMVSVLSALLFMFLIGMIRQIPEGNWLFLPLAIVAYFVPYLHAAYLFSK
jgi:hypothetical protein